MQIDGKGEGMDQIKNSGRQGQDRRFGGDMEKEEGIFHGSNF
jgi:hypothetical protein